MDNAQWRGAPIDDWSRRVKRIAPLLLVVGFLYGLNAHGTAALAICITSALLVIAVYPRLPKAVVAGLRMTLYAVLAVLRPFIVMTLSAVTVVGLILCLFYGLMERGTHFPTIAVFLASVFSAVLIVIFYAAMELLLPEN